MPPLPQPEIQSAGRVRRIANKSRRIGCFCVLLDFDFQKKRKEKGNRQMRVRLRVVWVFWEVVGATSTTVLMLAIEFCAAPLRLMLEGRSEQVA